MRCMWIDFRVKSQSSSSRAGGEGSGRAPAFNTEYLRRLYSISLYVFWKPNNGRFSFDDDSFFSHNFSLRFHPPPDDFSFERLFRLLVLTAAVVTGTMVLR